MKALRIVGLVLHVLIGGLMIFAGSGKVFGFAPTEVVKAMNAIGMADKMVLIGSGELISALLLILPWTMPIGLLLTSAFWGGVICIHMSHHEAYAPFAAMLVVVWIGAALRQPHIFRSLVGTPREAVRDRETVAL